MSDPKDRSEYWKTYHAENRARRCKAMRDRYHRLGGYQAQKQRELEREAKELHDSSKVR